MAGGPDPVGGGRPWPVLTDFGTVRYVRTHAPPRVTRPRFRTPRLRHAAVGARAGVPPAMRRVAARLEWVLPGAARREETAARGHAHDSCGRGVHRGQGALGGHRGALLLVWAGVEPHGLRGGPVVVPCRPLPERRTSELRARRVRRWAGARGGRRALLLAGPGVVEVPRDVHRCPEVPDWLRGTGGFDVR